MKKNHVKQLIRGIVAVLLFMLVFIGDGNGRFCDHSIGAGAGAVPRDTLRQFVEMVKTQGHVGKGVANGCIIARPRRRAEG